jgi:hypothetical protein
MTASSGGSGNWYNSAWAHRKLITVSSGQVTGTQTKFPMLVSLTNDGQLIASARIDGPDILFTDSNGTTLLPFEMESYSNGTLAAWVQVASLTTGSQIYMYYGNTGNATSLQNKPGVWDSYYKGVWHLSETLTANGQTVADSTGQNNATAQYTWVAGNQQAGKIGGSLNFNGGSPAQDIYAASSFGISSTTSPRTVSVCSTKRERASGHSLDMRD